MTDAVTRNLMLSSGQFEKEKKYWLAQLSGGLKLGAFFQDRDNTCNDENANGMPAQKEIFRFPHPLYEKILVIARGSEQGIFIILLAGLIYMVSRYSGKDDIIIGTPVLNRDKAQSYFNHMLPLRQEIRDGLTFGDFLRQLKETVSRAYENMNYPLDKILPQLGLTCHVCRLYDTVIIFKNIHGEGGYGIEPPGCSTAFIFRMTGEYLEGELHYASSLNDDIPTINQFWRHYINFFRVVTRSPLVKLADIHILTRDEENKLLYDFNKTHVEDVENTSIHRLFEEQVRKTPDKTALGYEGHHLTYVELEERANHLAAILRQKGTVPGSIVGIMMERSPAQIIGVFAVLKAGGTFLALDPKYPDQRLEFMVNDANVKVILTKAHRHDEHKSAGPPPPMIDGNRYWVPVAGQDQGKGREGEMPGGDSIGEIPGHTAGKPAYIIYTSGSTGKPKGVVGLHQGVINRCRWMQRIFPFKPGEVCCQKTSMNFVDSIWEMFGPLLAGIPLVIIPGETLIDLPGFLHTLERKCVSRIVLVPSLLCKILESDGENCKQSILLKYWIVSGETLSPRLLSRFKQWKPGAVLLNLYGSSEVSADATWWDTTGESIDKKRIPIGSPIDNLRIYILAENMQPVSLGVPGEIHIGGKGVARGYLNQPELTWEKFIPDPFLVRAAKDAKLFKSGDLGRYLPRGTIEFLGRVDHQVKIRGYRIEPAEIENHLLDIDEITGAVVIDRVDSTGERYLCAYVVMAANRRSAADIETLLSRELPGYMVPSRVVKLDKIPLTPNGKINRNALPEPAVVAKEEYIPPGNQIEKKLAGMWADILGIDRVGLDDNFFKIGGHSLKLMQFLSAVHREFKVKIPPGEIFYNGTLKEIAGYMEKITGKNYSSINPLEKKEYYPASASQKSYHIYSQLKGSKSVGITYNIPLALLVEGTAAKERIREILQKLVDRHEALRTSLITVNKETVQRVHDWVAIKVEETDAENQKIDKVIKDFLSPFDLEKAPLFRFRLAKLDTEKYLFFFDIHHSIADGGSLNILVDDFLHLYGNKKLNKLAVQFKDFLEWRLRPADESNWRKQGEYWFSVFADGVPELNMPLDRPRTWMQSFKGDNIYFEAGEELTAKINRLAFNTDTTLFMVLLAALNVLLHQYTRQEDFVVGVPIAGRPHPELEHVIGIFVNTLAVRNKLLSSETFGELLSKVKRNAIKAFENQDYPLGQLVEKLGVKKQFGRNPLFDILFVLQNNERIDLEIEGLKFTPVQVVKDSAEFDFTLDAGERNRKIFFRLEYGTRIYNRETAASMAAAYIKILENIVKDVNMNIGDIIKQQEGK